MTRIVRTLLTASLILSGLTAASAFADPRAKCGQEPTAPTVNASDTAHYNASVDRFQAYEKEARAYNSCVATQAQKEEQAISDEAKDRIAKVHAFSTSVQQKISANFSRLAADLTSGGKKLSKH